MFFPSLYACLDYVLPGLFRIRLHNFFSFLPFIKPIAPEILHLRRLINESKDPTYVNAYYLHQKMIKPFVGKHKFIPNAIELKILNDLDPSPAASSNVIQHLNEDEPFISKPKPIQSRLNFDTQPYVNEIKHISKQDDWQPAFNVFAKNQLEQLDNEDLYALVRALLNPAHASLNISFKACMLNLVLHVIKPVSLTDIFNQLAQQTDIEDYHRFLQSKAEVYVKQLIEAIDSLGNKTAEDGMQYNTIRDFFVFKHALRPFRDSFLIQHKSSALKTLELKFKDLQNKREDDSLVLEIKFYIQEIKTIIKLIEDNIKLKELTHQIQFNEQIQNRNFQERQDFNQGVLEGTIQAVSDEDLKRWFPDPKAYKDKAKQLRKLGIKITLPEDSSIQANRF